ncbi:hypothetical protein GCM10022222_18990 [Amycolatopsis ultiminotia]|uniref:Uncharacterized protein n=1 Tax=Amycolatopsis ultiminotia TaxID=543629 RepID=A0ABP6VKC6_9PSEU
MLALPAGVQLMGNPNPARPDPAAVKLTATRVTALTCEVHSGYGTDCTERSNLLLRSPSSPPVPG